MLVWDGSETSVSADDKVRLAESCADLRSDVSDHFDPLGDADAEAFSSTPDF
jgi:hypothetical protein